MTLKLSDAQKDNRNCVIMNQVLGDEIKTIADSLNYCRFKRAKADSTVSVQFDRIDDLQSSNSSKNIVIAIVSILLLACGYVFYRITKVFK